MSADRWLTPTDHRLLVALDAVANLVRAARAVGISRDRAVYRLQRLRRLYGRPAAVGHRGGGTVGATTLTPFGRSLVHSAGHPGANRWKGVYRRDPSPYVDLGEGRRVEVTFRARPGQRVTVEADPESFVIARERFELSARNVFKARLEGIRPLTSGRVVLLARWGGLAVRAALTPGSVQRLKLTRGQSAFFYLKAVAVRKV